MLEAIEILPRDPAQTAPDNAMRRVTLSFDQRRKSRYRTRTDCGVELGWFLPRGEVLTEGDRLLCRDGTRLRVRAADEEVSEVRCADGLLLSRAAYHLGNRHVPLDITHDRLRYQRDSVLDAMLAGLGLEVEHTRAPFNPENGAYHGQGPHGHGQSDEHVHSHAHPHPAAREHSHGD